jgi:hypothetical protein
MPRRTASLAALASLLGLCALAACSAPTPSTFAKSDSNQTSDPKAPGSFGAGASSGASGGPTAGGAACVPAKGNYDLPGDGCDNDGDGTVDNPATCDAALADDGSPEELARAMGLCNAAATSGFGLVSAAFTRGYGRADAPMAQQHGVLAKFGDVLRPREGARLGVLSTGYALEYDGSPGTPFGGNASGKDWFGARPGVGNGTAPPGFPRPAAGCPQASEVNDLIALKLTLTAPKNATGFKFDFNFHSGEWPAFICSEFNDGFIAYLKAEGFNGGVADNISFDAKKNPVSVNNGFFDRCTPGAAIGCDPRSTPGTSTCPGGPAELAGTGFGILGNYCGYGGAETVAGGATGWLTSQAPVKPGETFTLELMIWDAGDGDLDSLVVLDNFQWIGGAVVTQTGRPTGPN